MSLTQSKIFQLPLRAKRWAGRWKRYLLGQEVECNVCGWRGEKFTSDSWHPNTICPGCWSQVRHRMLVEAMSHMPQLSFQQLAVGKAILHFAPEDALWKMLKQKASRYLAVDYLALGYSYTLDARLDFQAMPFATGSLDLIIACDVLEHIPDYRGAMAEIVRILRPGGWAILTVPQKDNLAYTFEDPAITTPEAREKIYGQQDHLRIYGDDFSTMLEASGFRVTTVRHTDFPPLEVRYHVLFPPIRSNHPLATNYRKVYFAQRL